MALLIMLRNVKDDKIFLSAKFQFSVIQFERLNSRKILASYLRNLSSCEKKAWKKKKKRNIYIYNNDQW